MSNYFIKAKHNKTGSIYEITCVDNLFGPHKYGYIYWDEKGKKLVLNETEFQDSFDAIKNEPLEWTHKIIAQDDDTWTFEEIGTGGILKLRKLLHPAAGLEFSKERDEDD